MNKLEKVLHELSAYEHPFFQFSAIEKGDGVEVLIHSKIPDVLSPVYRVTVTERDLKNPQFSWTFQKLIYDCLADYVVELFTKTPGER